MKDRELKAYLQGSLQQETAVRPGKKEETMARCRQIMREQAENLAEERTGFWQFLSDVFRFEGLSIFGVQAGVLFLVCMSLGTMENVVCYLSVFTPLFALAVMPTLFRSQYYNMGEMEAVTRASGAEIILAKLLLAGAANLVCITVVLYLVLSLRQSCEGIGRIILYGLVPYLVSMTAILRLIRLRKKKQVPVCAVAAAGSCVVWAVLAKAMPQVYEASAAGLWILLFFLFAGFFGREIAFIWEMKREGKGYGIID